ncbi:MAG: hypothetical protein SGI88_07825 [Candidatus Hydrogenedentes bacterium]|nr:hypothetical protein [Candidatus Hydrogenedentota bacterium]
MDNRSSLIKMLKQLIDDMLVIQQQGAGYYSCTPLARRYNKLLAQGRLLFDSNDGLMGTFESVDETDPKDPADKMKVVQAIRVEIGQLLALLESSGVQPK